MARERSRVSTSAFHEKCPYSVLIMVHLLAMQADVRARSFGRPRFASSLY